MLLKLKVIESGTPLPHVPSSHLAGILQLVTLLAPTHCSDSRDFILPHHGVVWRWAALSQGFGDTGVEGLGNNKEGKLSFLSCLCLPVASRSLPYLPSNTMEVGPDLQDLESAGLLNLCAQGTSLSLTTAPALLRRQ